MSILNVFKKEPTPKVTQRLINGFLVEEKPIINYVNKHTNFNVTFNPNKSILTLTRSSEGEKYSQMIQGYIHSIGQIESQSMDEVLCYLVNDKQISLSTLTELFDIWNHEIKGALSQQVEKDAIDIVSEVDAEDVLKVDERQFIRQFLYHYFHLNYQKTYDKTLDSIRCLYFLATSDFEKTIYVDELIDFYRNGNVL